MKMHIRFDVQAEFVLEKLVFCGWGNLTKGQSTVSCKRIKEVSELSEFYFITILVPISVLFHTKSKLIFYIFLINLQRSCCQLLPYYLVVIFCSVSTSIWQYLVNLLEQSQYNNRERALQAYYVLLFRTFLQVYNTRVLISLQWTNLILSRTFTLHYFEHEFCLDHIRIGVL